MCFVRVQNYSVMIIHNSDIRNQNQDTLLRKQTPKLLTTEYASICVHVSPQSIHDIMQTYSSGYYA